MLSVVNVMLSVLILNAVKLSVIMLSAILLNAVMVNVRAPILWPFVQQTLKYILFKPFKLIKVTGDLKVVIVVTILLKNNLIKLKTFYKDRITLKTIKNIINLIKKNIKTM